MQSEKISISLPQSLVRFVEDYKITRGCRTRYSRSFGLPRSQVIEEALELLRRELESAYREASKEVDDAWDITLADGLSDETW